MVTGKAAPRVEVSVTDSSDNPKPNGETKEPETPPAATSDADKQNFISKKEFDTHAAGLRRKYESQLADANAALEKAQSELEAARAAKKPEPNGANKPAPVASNGAPAGGEPDPRFEQLTDTVAKLADAVTALTTNAQQQEKRTRENHYDNAVSSLSKLTDAQKSMLRTVYDGLDKPPDDVAAWVKQQAAVFGVTAEASGEEKPVDPTKDKTGDGDSSAISGSAPAGPAAYEGVIDLVGLGKDDINALRSRGLFFKKLEQYRDNLPGGSGAIFGKRPDPQG